MPLRAAYVTALRAKGVVCVGGLQMVSLSLAHEGVAFSIAFSYLRELHYLQDSLHFAPTFVFHPFIKTSDYP